MLAFGVPPGLGDLLRGWGWKVLLGLGCRATPTGALCAPIVPLTGGSNIIQNHKGKGGRLQGLQPAQGAICERHALLSLRIPLCRSGGRAWPIT